MSPPLLEVASQLLEANIGFTPEISYIFFFILIAYLTSTSLSKRRRGTFDEYLQHTFPFSWFEVIRLF